MSDTSSVNEKVWEFLLSGGIFMAFIAVCSLVAVAVSIHRMLSLRWSSIMPEFLQDEWSRCEEYFAKGKTSQLLNALRKSDTPFGTIAQVVLSAEFSNRADAAEAVESSAKEQIVKLDGGMGVLEVVITISPLLGLLGTVSGLVGVFATLGNSEDVADPVLIAAGIATALNTTIAGLVVAVIAVILHSYFTRRLEGIAARLEVMISHLLHLFYKHGGPALYDNEAIDGEKLQRPQQEIVDAIELSANKVDNRDPLS